MDSHGSLLPFAYLFALFGVLSLVHAGRGWWRVAREADRERVNERPVLNVTFVRAAAERTTFALYAVAATLAVVIIDWLIGIA